jgi:hypothetical protein
MIELTLKGKNPLFNHFEANILNFGPYFFMTEKK